MNKPPRTRANPGPKLVVKPPPESSGKDSGAARKVFEQLPAKTKELELMRDEAEKTTGPQAAALHKAIREKSR